MKRMNNIVNIVLNCIRKVIITPCEKVLLKICRKLLKIKDNLIVFETEGDFWDNGRAFYEYLINNNYNKKYKIVWFVHKPELYQHSDNVEFISRFNYGINFKAIKVISQAKCFLFTHPYWLKNWRHEQKVINLTHSTMALKSGGVDVSDCFDYILCASEKAKEIKRITYNASERQMIVLGSPRNDLLNNNLDLKKLFSDYDNEKLVLSMVTFRQTVSNKKDSQVVDKYSLGVVKTDQQMLELNEYLKTNNILLVMKIHHLQTTEQLTSLKLSNVRYLKDADLISKNIQLYELLGRADMLLTDYSSVFYDYLFLNRPIGFLVGDIDAYERGFCVEDPLSHMPGEKIYTYDNLMSFLGKFIENKDEYYEVRKKMLEEVHYYKKDHCERLLKWLESEIL